MPLKKIAKSPRQWLSDLNARFGLYLCHIGFHKYLFRPILASLDTYWVQGGVECTRCSDQRISFYEAARITKSAYERGKLRSENDFLAHGKGVKDVVKLYGKAHVQRMLDDVSDA